jgi:2-hydroxy-3-oxopropionate reductase
MKIGFIGTGVMGRPMAGHLLKAGHQIFLCGHRSPLPSELVEHSATVCQSHADVARESDCVILMVPDTAAVESALFGDGGVASGLSAGKLVIDMSSIDPIATKEFAAKIEGLGCDYVDAPVSGGEIGAKNATLTIMVGAKDDAFARAKPLFDVMGKNITLIGGVGSGQTAKIANQIIVALTIEAVAEALVFASKAGVDPARVREALMGGFAGSKVLEVHGERMIKRTFDPGFRIRLHQKDLNLALSAGRILGVPLPNTASTQQLFTNCAALGHGERDHSMLVSALELLAGLEQV